MAEQIMQEAAGKAIPVGYKQTEVGVIPEDWKLEKLGMHVAFRTGPFGSALHKSDYVDGGIPIINPMQIIDGKLEPTYSMAVSDEAAKKLADFRLSAGDIVIGRRGDMGRCAVVSNNENGWLCGTGSMIIRVRPSCDALFLQRLLSSPSVISEIENASAGSTMINLNQSTLRELELVIPQNKQEQTAIANVLSDSDALIDALEQLIAKKQAIKSATMQQLLTGRTRLPAFALRPNGTPKGYKPSELGEIPEDWEVTYLLDVATLIHGKAHEPYVTEAGKYIVINSKFVSTGGEVRKYCSQNDCAARNGDVLMVLSDLPNGKALAKCFYADQNNVYAVNQRVCIFRTNIIDPKYLYLVLNRHKYFLALDDGVTQTHILNGDIANCQLYAPVNKAEQTAIATILSDMDNELQALTQKLDKARALKQGMMQQLLTGKIRLPLTAGA
ncbi:TPA: restriction endonuclease subunit S [Aeromonas veronii]